LAQTTDLIDAGDGIHAILNVRRISMGGDDDLGIAEGRLVLGVRVSSSYCVAGRPWVVAQGSRVWQKERENEREMHKENNERLTNGRVPSQKDEIERCPRENERREDGDGERFEGRGGGFSKRAAFPQGLRRQYIHTRRHGEFLARLHYQDRLAYIHNTIRTTDRRQVFGKDP
jgi:hypothetical protein